MCLLAQLQKEILLDCKEIFIESMESTRNSQHVWDAKHTTFPMTPTELFSAGDPQERMEKLLSQVSLDEWRSSIWPHLDSKI